MNSRLQLAIETAGRSGSIALIDSSDREKPRVLDDCRLPAEKRTATVITDAIGSMVGGHQLWFVSVASGPGSFTGLRIGVTTAKTLAFAWQIPLVSVDSLAAIASTTFFANPNAHDVCVGIDAYRGQVFAGQFHRATVHQQPPSTPANVMAQDQWRKTLLNLDDHVCLAGDTKCFANLENHPERLLQRPTDATGVAMIAHQAAWRNAFTDPLRLVPNYLKPSAAEEKASLSDPSLKDKSND